MITQGEGSVIAVDKEGVRTFPVSPLHQAEIVDTNRAGDAFVGGFLAQWVLGAGLDAAVKCGIWVASHSIKRSGYCSMPDVCDF